MGILNNSNAISVDSGYDITDSLRFRSSASAYLNRTPASDGNRRTWTWSCWVKRGSLATSGITLFGTQNDSANSDYDVLYFDGNKCRLLLNGGTGQLNTTQVFRDSSAWYHIVLAIDTTQATDTNRMKMYINGVQVTAFDTATYVSVNYDTWVNKGGRVATIGAAYQSSASNYLDGYLTEVNFVDGTALAPSDFGETDSNGTWIPKKYLGTYGTNGFYLPIKPTTQATGFNTVLYAGNSASQTMTNVGFAPDLVWYKRRTGSNDHTLIDSVRGSANALSANGTAAEYQFGSNDLSFTSTGFTLTDTGTQTNASGQNYVAWCWDAGGSTVTNTEGTLSAQVRANPASGFSIITCTGSSGTPTIGHGLDTAPKLLMRKTRNISDNWGVYAEPVGNDKIMSINTDGAAATNDVFGDTTPTADVFTMKPGTNDWVIYAFADVTGYQKIGSYSGTGSSNAVTTGFRPAFVMTKRTNGGGGWNIADDTRSVNNPKLNTLEWNTSNAESTSTAYSISFTDTGFVLNDSDDARNGSGDSYIYLAIADTRDAKYNFDASGNKNNWTSNNINSNASGESSYDLMSDVPTLTDEDTSNFAVINPLHIAGTASNGNLTHTNSAGGSWQNSFGTIHISSGKWYWEGTVSGGIYHTIGVATSEIPLTYGWGTPSSGSAFAYIDTSGNKIGPTGYSSGSSYGASFTSGDVIGVALDLDSGTLTFYKNGVSQGVAFNSGLASTSVTPIFGEYNSVSWDINFGQRPFAYTPPTGYKKLNTFNLPDSTITNGREHFDTALYTGSGATRSIDNTITASDGTETGEAFKFGPDLTWIKVRNSASYEHMWFDSVRGVTKYIRSNTNSGEGTVASTLTSFDSNGFSLGNNNDVNGSGFPIVAWNWKAGGATAANTDGSIATQISANTTAGFNIVSYSGNGSAATVGHGLGVIPDMIITKNRSTINEWCTWHKDLSGAFASDGAYIYLNSSAAAYTTSVFYDGTGISSTRVAFRGGTGEVNASGNNYIMYAFKSVEGYSKFGSYTGNGSTDGPFVYTGFRPAFVIIKSATEARNWLQYDTAVNTYNQANTNLFPNLSSAEYTSATYAGFDILSNGFKLRNNDTSGNNSGQTMIYMAFAENPFKNSNAR